MRLRITISTVVRAALLGLLVLVAAAGCGEKRSVSPATSTGELPDQEVSDFAITETDQGRVEWKLYAKQAAMFSARNRVVAQRVRIDFFDETDGARSSELVAREGEINQRTRDMIARGNVVLETREGTRLSSEELRFLNKEQKILVPENLLVRVEKGGDVLTGYGFESDPEMKRWEFKRRVQATVRTQSGGGIVEQGGGR
jgi:LPS export ABC transporter protein LptC